MSQKNIDYLKRIINWSEQVDTLLLDHREEEDLKSWDEWKGKLRDHLDSDKLPNNEIVLIKQEAESYYEKWHQRLYEQEVPIGKHKLPKLPYAYDALEPFIEEEIMRLHHQKHHQSYVDGLNRAEKALNDASSGQNNQKYWLREQAFNGSGHYLHTIFWFNMSPDGGGIPSNNQPLLQQINHDFGSVEMFKKKFTQAASAVEGSGWAILAWSPRSRRLVIHFLEKHQHFALADTIPLLVLDLWEHAYYLQYKNARNDYIKAWWNVVNWNNVNKRYMEARKLKWKPF